MKAEFRRGLHTYGLALEETGEKKQGKLAVIAPVSPSSIQIR